MAPLSTPSLVPAVRHPVPERALRARLYQLGGARRDGPFCQALRLHVGQGQEYGVNLLPLGELNFACAGPAEPGRSPDVATPADLSIPPDSRPYLALSPSISRCSSPSRCSTRSTPSRRTARCCRCTVAAAGPLIPTRAHPCLPLRIRAHPSSPLLTFAHPCSPLLTLAHPCSHRCPPLSTPLSSLAHPRPHSQVPPWVNPWLLLAMGVSFGLHFVIMCAHAIIHYSTITYYMIQY